MKTLDQLRENGLLATEINKLESRLWRLTRRENIRTVLITSAVRGEGKSMTLAHLATSLGLYPGRRILAMDFDFRIPTMASQFGIRVPVGIDKVLEGQARLEDAILATELPSLQFAAPSVGGADPALLLRSQELASMFGKLRENYDLILLDTPAIIPVSDPTMLLPFADGVILAAMAGKTTGPQLQRAREICEGMDANILGLVVGNVQEAAPDYLAGDYDYGYYGPRPESRSETSPRSTANGPRQRKPARKPARRG